MKIKLNIFVTSGINESSMVIVFLKMVQESENVYIFGRVHFYSNYLFFLTGPILGNANTYNTSNQKLSANI